MSEILYLLLLLPCLLCNLVLKNPSVEKYIQKENEFIYEIGEASFAPHFNFTSTLYFNVPMTRKHFNEVVLECEVHLDMKVLCRTKEKIKEKYSVKLGVFKIKNKNIKIIIINDKSKAGKVNDHILSMVVLSDKYDKRYILEFIRNVDIYKDIRIVSVYTNGGNEMAKIYDKIKEIKSEYFFIINRNVELMKNESIFSEIISELKTNRPNILILKTNDNNTDNDAIDNIDFSNDEYEKI